MNENEYDEKLLKYLVDLLDSIELKGYEGIKCGSALHLKLISPWNKASYMYLIKKLILDFFYSNYKKEKIGNGKIVFFYSNANKTRAYVHDKMEKVEQIISDKICLKPGNIGFVMKRLFKIPLLFVWYKQLNLAAVNKKTKWFICSFLLEGLYEIDSVRKCIRNENVNLFISVHDSRFLDSIIVQYMNKHHIHTATLQHGAFSLPTEKIDYEYSLSEYFLSYGAYYSNLAIKCGLNPQKVIALGIPQFVKVKRFTETCPNVFGIILNHEKYAEGNRLLIEIGNKLSSIIGKKYRIKYHPSLNPNDYENIIDRQLCLEEYGSEISSYEFGKKIDFAIASRTTVFLEYIYLRIPIFRYVSVKEPDMYSGIEKLKFETDVELLDLINEYNNIKNKKEWLGTIADQLIEPGKPEDNYYRFLSQFME